MEQTYSAMYGKVSAEVALTGEHLGAVRTLVAVVHGLHMVLESLGRRILAPTLGASEMSATTIHKLHVAYIL